MADQEIDDLQKQIYALTMRLNGMLAEREPDPVKDYTFQTAEGETTLRELFGDRDRLLVIHNMGETCQYCTLWADGFNGLLPHLEDAMSVVLVSKDSPQTQRRFALARGWGFRLASHGGGDYIKEQTVRKGEDNYPGAVVYERRGDEIVRKNSCIFGPGDQYCSMWNLLGLAGMNEKDWIPKYHYWQDTGESA